MDMETTKSIAIIGAGPAALIAAEQLAAQGYAIDIYDRMPSPGRKLLIAGRGGLNLTHSEALPTFMARYGDAAEWLEPAIRAFPPNALTRWCEGLGEEVFVGTSGRVFPKRMKATGLLRALLKRLEARGVQYHPHHTWVGWEQGLLIFDTPRGRARRHRDATLLALGGASWPRLGSNGAWTSILEAQGVPVAPLRPANSGFITNWSDHMKEKFAGQPLKPLAVTHEGVTIQGEAMITAQGIEGGVIYALSSSIREAIIRNGATTIHLDLRPGMTLEALSAKLAARGSKSLGSFLRSAGFSPLDVALLHELVPGDKDAGHLAERLKALPLTLRGTTSIDRAISSAGGVTRDAFDDNYMLKAMPGVFVAGEMLDWEAPTGGYLLQACFSTGVAAARGIETCLKH